MTGRVTLRDVALRAGYSTATVSLALRDHARIPEPTRVLIRRMAREMGYHPDPLLASIAACRWRRSPASSGSTLAAISDGRIEGQAGMEERAARLGYRIEVFSVKDYPDGRWLSDVLYHRGVMGLLVGQIFTPGFVESFDWSHFSAVAVSEGYFRPPVHLVMPNHFRSVQTTWDHAQAMGCRRIGLLIFDMPDALDFHDRRAGFLERQLQVPLARRLPILAVDPEALGGPLRGEALRGIGAWAKRHSPDVVLGFNCAFFWVLRDAGLRVPEDIAFLSLWIQGNDKVSAGARLSPDEVGRRAVDWVDSLLRAGERGLPASPATMEIEMTWEDAPATPAGG